MHAPEYIKRIKALITAKDKTEENMKRILFQFRNGRKPNPVDIEDARKAFNDFLTVLEEQEGRDTKRERAIQTAQQEDSETAAYDARLAEWQADRREGI